MSLAEENPLFSEDQDAKKINAKLVLKSTVVLLVVVKRPFYDFVQFDF